MPRPTIEYLSARKELRKGSDHSAKRAVKYCPDNQLDLSEQTELKVESMWSDYRIQASFMWEQIFARFGLNQGLELEETF